MRIVWYFNDDKQRVSGPAINALRLLPVLKEKGHQVLALVGHYDKGKPNADALTAKGINVELYRLNKYADSNINNILQIVQKVNPDIFVSNTSAHAALAGRWIKHAGIPVVHTLRGNDKNNLGMAEFFFDNTPWQLSSLVAVNNALKYKTKHLLPDIKCDVIPSGVIIPDYMANQKEAQKVGFVFAGRIINENKNLKSIIKLFIELSVKNPSWFFSLIGSVSDKGFRIILEKAIKENNCSGTIRFIDRLTGEEYLRELTKHHFSILMSDHEGTPGSVMDAMACGLIPLVRNIEGMNELVVDGFNGYLIDGMEEAFLQKIDEIKDDVPNRIKLAKNARKTIQDNFSLEIAADKWDKLFKQLINVSDTKSKIEIPLNLSLPPENHLLVHYRLRPDIFTRMRDYLQIRTRIRNLLKKTKIIE